jgi:hypothetical protein
VAEAKTLPPADVTVPKTKDELVALLKRSQSGDHTALPVVRKMLEDPANLRLFGGELAETVAKSFIKAMGGEDIGFREAMLRKMELLRAELLGESPTPVEKFLVEHIVACWLQVQDADLRAAQNQNNATMAQIDFFQRRMDATNRRFLAAIKTLATVRKLAVPMLQVNIAKKQVNIVTQTPVADGSA